LQGVEERWVSKLLDYQLLIAGDMRSRLITGLAGLELTTEEKGFLASVRPAGIILFARNCGSPDQIRRLVAGAIEAIGADEVLVLIDQEGGRVQRLRPPLGRALPPARAFGRLYDADADVATKAAKLVFRLLAKDLLELGINTDCAPVLDLPVRGAHDVIGDRAYATTVAPIVALGRAVAEGLMAGGVVPVMKHVPGHGRANCDSHLALPIVDDSLETLQRSDFQTFQELSDLPAAMTAHVVFGAIDGQAPATTSRCVVVDIIRRAIGFDGLLMSDDLSMKALSGTMRSRAEATIAAGCDLVLHCNGDLEEMAAAAAGTPCLEGEALSRFAKAWAITQAVEDFDTSEAEAALSVVFARGSA
jgi:beta-N-acetylhexosaminidase